MKSEVYRRKVDTHILDAISGIKERQDELRRATRHVLTVTKIIDVDGGIFENLLQTNKFVS
jgi:hypothetical protein